ncbi:MAG TPA: redox-regulated ATPase YchF [Syntrophomonadaceae bacterium]|nr:redox-regulated ATPase YchF [Syntrophomonadaceae bacterium]
MQLGIIGLPMVGKTTIFELLTENKNQSSNTLRTNIGMARIPDYRIDRLVDLVKPKKTIYAQLEVVDIPGLSPGAEKSSNIFLDSVRKADALLHVVRAFESNMVGPIQPLKDMEIINYELLLADLDLIEKRIARINENKKKNEMQLELDLLARLQDALENELPISSLKLNDEEEEIIDNYQFLTTKPLLICVNIAEDDLATKSYKDRAEIMSFAEEAGLQIVEISAAIEKEIVQLDMKERTAFMNDLGIEESGIVQISRSMYKSLGLLAFFTVGEVEVRAWTINDGDTARKAAGKIHSDIERGFIRAEVVEFSDLIELGSMPAVKEKGLFRLEGKEYIVKDGDIVNFRFNV